MNGAPLSQDGSSGAVDRIAVAREGSSAALGHLLEQCRDYLLLVANQELDADMRAMIGPSDLVQDTFLQAQQHFAGFRGQSEGELLAWLRAILLNRRLEMYRRYRETEKRRIDREQLVDQAVIAADFVRQVTTEVPSPSQIASHAEQTVMLERFLEQLPGDYRQVIRLRYWGQLKFAEIGPQMGRSAEAARKLWFRAIERLSRILEKQNGRRP